MNWEFRKQTQLTHRFAHSSTSLTYPPLFSHSPGAMSASASGMSTLYGSSGASYYVPETHHVMSSIYNPGEGENILIYHTRQTLLHPTPPALPLTPLPLHPNKPAQVNGPCVVLQPVGSKRCPTVCLSPLLDAPWPRPVGVQHPCLSTTTPRP